MWKWLITEGSSPVLRTAGAPAPDFRADLFPGEPGEICIGEPGHFCAAAYTGPLRRLVSGQQKNTADIHTCRAKCLRCFFDFSLRIRTGKNRLSSKRTEYYEVRLP